MERIKEEASRLPVAQSVACKSVVIIKEESPARRPVPRRPGLLRAMLGRCLPGLGLRRPPHRCYREWIRQRVKTRREEYTVQARPGLFSILTPVFDPPARCLRDLARSVLRQDQSEFEWVIVDNGSRQPGVRRLLERLRT